MSRITVEVEETTYVVKLRDLTRREFREFAGMLEGGDLGSAPVAALDRMFAALVMSVAGFDDLDDVPIVAAARIGQAAADFLGERMERSLAAPTNSDSPAISESEMPPGSKSRTR